MIKIKDLETDSIFEVQHEIDAKEICLQDRFERVSPEPEIVDVVTNRAIAQGEVPPARLRRKRKAAPTEEA